MTTNAIAFAIMVQSIVAHMDDIPSRDKAGVSAMVWSIAGQESSWRDCNPYHDVNSQAWGYFGMHEARWGEVRLVGAHRDAPKHSTSNIERSTSKMDTPKRVTSKTINSQPPCLISPNGSTLNTAWGSASPRVQVECMARAIQRRVDRERGRLGMRADVLDPRVIRAVCLWHNGYGGKESNRDRYRRSVSAHLATWSDWRQVLGDKKPLVASSH